MKAVVFTLGCKVNDVESGSIIRGLEELGYEVSRKLEPADVYILNTCAVTGEAERKSRQCVARALKFNPTAKVIVCGCASQKSPNAFMEKSGVFCVTGAQKKGEVLKIAQSGYAENFSGVRIQDEKFFEDLPAPKCLKTRNFVKIQDGCNRFCSYCVIPYLRGRSRSRTIESAAKEILESQAFETVVTGIDISDYKDGEKDLADLLYAVKDAPTRIRLGSLEESVITDRFLQAAKEVKNFAPQFHLSLQSGSDKVLKSMNRKYTRAEYLEKCEKIYAAFENAAITTDIIVGFPTEDEDDFLASLSIIKEAGFSQVHAFPYSPREGTNAWKKYKELDFSVKKQRLDILLNAAAEQKTAYEKGCIGKTLTFIPETYESGYTAGYTENYVRAYIKGKTEKKPQRIKIKELFQDGVLAEAER
ncbi:MAG: tRNA (N(6)-L-threonylcarbamoyladenosine(37)-C(2))-methylthiotransferase MtaB [Clostridia bacterium]|nr:tRNA (N(6)-L-threonylcarbamoyladenosine(37)-C(2))-methylthiotransferase MtaB [Clostridia bacterium]